jgi:hypothetical protein
MTLTTVACAGILDPCSCNAVTYNTNEIMEVKDFIEVNGTTGQTWTLVQNGGGSNPLNGGQPYGTMQTLDLIPPFTTTNIDLPFGAPGGTVLTEVSPGKYRLDFAHDSGKGYIATVRNTTAGNTGGQELSVFNYCVITTFTPDINIAGTLCESAGRQLLSSFIQDPTPPVAGVVSYSYSVNGGPSKDIGAEFNPLGLAGASVKILAKYTPEAGNLIDCVILREATGAISITACALPINLIHFSGKPIADGIMLNWKAADEKQFSHFELQRTASGTEFITISKINLNKVSNGFYNYFDANPEKENNYYRLKMVDLDGAINYSKIININFEKEINFANTINPILNNEIIISTDLKNPKFELLNSSGAKIDFTTISTGNNNFSLKPISPIAGIYFLNISSNAKSITKKIIIP